MANRRPPRLSRPPLSDRASVAADDPKCARCRTSFFDGELVLRGHEEWLHFRCSRVPSADSARHPQAHAQRGDAMIAQSAAVIAQTMERLGWTADAHDPPPLR
jgi:hypothetical protein